jgi:hypothetical protein
LFRPIWPLSFNYVSFTWRLVKSLSILDYLKADILRARLLWMVFLLSLLFRESLFWCLSKVSFFYVDFWLFELWKDHSLDRSNEESEFKPYLTPFNCFLKLGNYSSWVVKLMVFESPIYWTSLFIRLPDPWGKELLLILCCEEDFWS